MSSRPTSPLTSLGSAAEASGAYDSTKHQQHTSNPQQRHKKKSLSSSSSSHNNTSGSNNNLNSIGGNSNSNSNSNLLTTMFDQVQSASSSTSQSSTASAYMKRTPSQIIREARERCEQQQQQSLSPASKRNFASNEPTSATTNFTLRTLNSQRPFTPREETRNLFGPNTIRANHERPPSQFSFNSKCLDIEPVRPLSATRLSPIEKLPYLLSSSSSSNNQFQQSQQQQQQQQQHPIEQPIKSAKSTRLAPLDTSGASFDNKLQLTTTAMRKSVIHESTDTSSASKNNKARMLVDEEDDGRADSANLEEEAIWKGKFEPLLATLATSFSAGRADIFCESCARLDQLITVHQAFVKSSNKRSTILKQIFEYLDTDGPESELIKIHTARLILNMRVSSRNLTNICRLLFSMSRNPDNDSLFMDEYMLDTMLNSSKRLDFKDNSDSVIYFCGLIKNLTENQRILKKLSVKNVEEILLRLFKELNKYFKDTGVLKAEAGNALVQLTAILRNLADLSTTRRKFLGLNLIEQLVNVLKYYTGDSELMLNTSRILSKITLHADCCQELATHDSCYKSFVKIMIKHGVKQDLIVRIGFVLGNLTSRNDSSRLKFANEKYAVETVINTLKFYFLNDLKMIEKKQKFASQEEEETEPTDNEDVMIKLIRVIANLAISEQVGLQLSERLDLIDIILKILENKGFACDELIMNTLVTLNNLTFYNSNAVIQSAVKLIDVLMKYLLSDNLDAVLEAFRVLANLSRHQSVRNYLIAKKVAALSVAYLSSTNREFVYIVVGVLINIMSDPDNRPILKQEKGVQRLIELLNDIGPNDWQLSAMICQLLMNYSERIGNKNTAAGCAFELDEKYIIGKILSELLDERFAIRDDEAGVAAGTSSSSKMENSFSSETNDPATETSNLATYMNELWRSEFQPVASLLVRRVIEET